MNSIHFDTLIIGAGISGISAAHYMQTDCPNKTYGILEGRKNIGGTWDLFRYPGIRSDSDMYTFGFAFRPWTNAKTIAPREAIIKYLEDTIKEEGIDQHILFEHRVNKATWSSENSLWTISANTPDSDQPKIFTCSFLSLCTGYYDYEKGFTPTFKGSENFKGQIVHPQKWTADIDYADKKIIVIGSGATAITLIPSLAEKATHVTMLQRSPTYIATQPSIDKLGQLLYKILPTNTAFKINRWRKIRWQQFTYSLARKYPNFIKKTLLKKVKEALGPDFDINLHFTPKYEPWDERLCLAPDGDIFTTIKNKKASVITDHIEEFIENGIQLKSGEILEADMIVTATGLNATVISNFDIEVDGKLIDFSKTVAYKGCMFSDIPNMTLAFGYTNASWTLKCDMVSQYVCRLINHMEKNGYQQCCPEQNDPNLKLEPYMDFTPGYILRVLDRLPKKGSTAPWRVEQNYFYDKDIFEKSALDDGVIVFK
ncbi:MAG: flavin-containing monooxygenase [Saprospiraceae bacterium]